MRNIPSVTSSCLGEMSIETEKTSSFRRLWHLGSKLSKRKGYVNSKHATVLETEAHVETTVTDKETVQPIEEASTVEITVPTGASIF